MPVPFGVLVVTLPGPLGRAVFGDPGVDGCTFDGVYVRGPDGVTVLVVPVGRLVVTGGREFVGVTVRVLEGAGCAAGAGVECEGAGVEWVGVDCPDDRFPIAFVFLSSPGSAGATASASTIAVPDRNRFLILFEFI